jgi:hypothetical protein
MNVYKAMLNEGDIETLNQSELFRLISKLTKEAELRIRKV